MSVNIEQLLPQDNYDALVGANNPSALNVYATMADLSAFVTSNIYTADGALAGNRTVTGGGNDLTFTGVNEFKAFANNSSLSLGSGPGDWALTGAGSGQISTSALLSIQSFSGSVNLLGNQVTIHSIAYPSTDGSANNVMITNGSGVLSFVDISTLIPPSTNIYNSNGTLTGNRIVTTGSSTVSFNTGTGTGFIIDPTNTSISMFLPLLGSPQGVIQMGALSGSQTWTMPDNTGTVALLSDIPAATGDGIYTGSGSLSGPTTVTHGANTLTFDGSTTFQLASGEAVTINQTNSNFGLVTTSTGNFSWQHAGNKVLFMDGSGNVGIGNSTASVISAGVHAFSSSNGTSVPHFRVSSINNGNPYFEVFQNTIRTYGSNSALWLRGNSDGDARIQAVYDGNRRIAFRNSSDVSLHEFYITGPRAGDVALAINTGDVGVGFSGNPTAKLHVVGAGSTLATTAMRVTSAGGASTMVFARNDGFVALNASGQTGLLEKMRLNGQTFISQGGLLISSSNGVAASTVVDLNSGLASTGGVFTFNAGANTNNVNFKIFNNSDPDLFVVTTDGGDGRIGVMTASASVSSTLTVTGDIEAIGTTNGLILQDRTSGTRYRVYIDATGVLHTEAA